MGSLVKNDRANILHSNSHRSDNNSNSNITNSNSSNENSSDSNNNTNAIAIIRMLMNMIIEFGFIATKASSAPMQSCQPPSCLENYREATRQQHGS